MTTRRFPALLVFTAVLTSTTPLRAQLLSEPAQTTTSSAIMASGAVALAGPIGPGGPGPGGPGPGGPGPGGPGPDPEPSLTITKSVSYNLQLNGTDQSKDTPVTLSVSNTAPNGWQVTVAATPLITGTSKTIPPTWELTLNGSTASAFAATAPVVSPVGPGPYVLPADNITYPVTVPGIYGGSSLTPATVYMAAQNTGMGNFDIAGDLWLTVPANALVGAYTSTLTWTIVEGGP